MQDIEKDSVKVCSNCNNYGWCDRNMKPTKQFNCSQCQTQSEGWVLYCSKVCQLEHWKKVHKRHCKYLAGKSIKPNSRHCKETCPKCKLYRDTSHGMGNQDNPIYPCHIEESFPGISTGFKLRAMIEDPVPYMITGAMCISLGELTGNFISKHEKKICILQQIFFKVRSDRRRPINIDFFKGIFWTLGQLREKVWKVSLEYHAENYLDYQMSIWGPNAIQKLDADVVTNVINLHGSMMKAEHQGGNLKWWSSFLLFLQLRNDEKYFYRSIFELQKISDETFDKFQSNLKLKQIVRNNNFFPVWETLLSSASDQLPEYSQLIKMLCEGQVERKCEVCSTEITVTSFYPQLDVDNEQSESVENLRNQFVEGKSCVITRPIKLYCCKRTACRETIFQGIAIVYFQITKEGTALAQRFEEYRCDNCFMVNDQAHRCGGCKTKVYCSLECQDEDWKIHQMCCADLSQDVTHIQRKKKANTEKRKELGVERMDYIAGMFRSSLEI